MYFLKSKQDQNSIDLAKKVINFFKRARIGFCLDVSLDLPGKKSDIKSTEPDAVIAIGDDNLILNAFRELGEKETPMLGIASVQSFLAQCNALNFEYCLELLEKGKYAVFKRSRIVAKFDSKTTPIALNDIGLFSAKSASLLRYTLNLNNEKFMTDTAGGFVGPPRSGGPGYSFSAGAPVILDDPRIFSIPPIPSLKNMLGS